MKIEVKGHSGCQINVVPEGHDIFIYKSTSDPKYVKRLVLQAEKQKKAGEVEYSHIRIPKILDIGIKEGSVSVKMEYVYSRNFVDFFEQAGFEQIEYLIEALKYFIDYEVGHSRVQRVSSELFRSKFAEVKSKCISNTALNLMGDNAIMQIIDRSEMVFFRLKDLNLPIGLCHGDLTFSNILFNGNNYFLIDFLDNFVETPLQDIVKIRQDSKHLWSPLMYNKHYDEVRLHIILNKIDKEIDSYFGSMYPWYRECYHVMQLMNLLRILPYAHEEKVISHLKNELNAILDEF